MEVKQFTPPVPDKCAECTLAQLCAGKLGTKHIGHIQMAESHMATDEQLQILERDNPGAYASVVRATRNANTGVQLHFINSIYSQEVTLQQAWLGCAGLMDGECSLSPEIRSQLTR